jgi:hypothetical protein
MAQLAVSWFICNGRLRVHAINAIGQRKGRIIELEDVDTGDRFHGSARRMEQLVRALQGAGDDRRHDRAWTPEPNS